MTYILHRSNRKYRILRWFARVVTTLAAIILLSGLIYGCSTTKALEKEISEVQRNPDTGVMIGCEARDIDALDVGSTAKNVIHSTDESHIALASTRPSRAALLVHGFCGSATSFSDLGERIAAEGIHVRLMRLPGHGTTPKDLAGQTPETICEGVRKEFQALSARYDEVYVVGYSMGGALSKILAAECPVDRLVLVAPYFGVTYKPYYILPAEAWNAVLNPILPYVVKPKGSAKLNCPDKRDEIFSYRVIPTNGVKTLMTLGRRARREDLLERIKCPVLLVMSKGDGAASPARVRKAFEHVGSSAKLAVWYPPKNNHLLLQEWDREDVKDRIVSFLACADDLCVSANPDLTNYVREKGLEFTR